MQISTFQAQATSTLSSVYDPLEARAVVGYLLEHVTGLSPSQLSIYKQDGLNPSQLAALENGIIRLQAHEPIQYITGKAYFWGEALEVSPAVLIPRQETEELVDWIIKAHQGKTLQILDIGTGSGCIAITLAKCLNKAQVHALDYSADALEIAKRNAERLGVRVHWHQKDILQASSQDFDLFDIIVSNPPYVLQSEQVEMPPYVLAHEPKQALFVPDEQPLLFYEKIAQLGYDCLKKEGQLFVEINEALGTQVVSLFEEIGYRDVRLRQDLNQKDRMVRAWK